MLLIIVHRFFQNFIFPPLNSMIFMIIGLSILKYHFKIGVSLLIFGLISLYIQSIPLTAYILSKELEIPAMPISELNNAQAIVILGGGINGNSFEYESGVNANKGTLIRINYTAYLAKMSPNKLIVTSGGYTGKYRDANVMKDILINAYNVKNPIITENKSRNTDENAKFVANILLPMHIKNVIVVTQAFHMRRAIMLFKKYGLNPTPASTDYYISDDALTPVLSLIPTTGAMQQVSTIYHELIGYYIYKN